MTHLRRIGIIQILLAGVCFGFLGLFGKSAFNRGISTQELLGIRFLFGAFIVFAIQFMRGKGQSLRLGNKQLILCMFLGIAGYASFSSFYFQAIQGLSASVAVLLLYTFPLWVAVGGRIFLQEKIDRQKLIVFPLTFGGLLLISWGEMKVQGPSYFFMGLGSAILYAAYILISRKHLQGVDGFTSVVYIQLAAGLVLIFSGFRSLERLGFVLQEFGLQIILMAIICGAGAMGLFQTGLQKIKSWEASLFSTSEPITAIVLASLFLQESLSGRQLLGGGLVLVAFVIMSIPVDFLRKQRNRSEVIS